MYIFLKRRYDSTWFCLCNLHCSSTRVESMQMVFFHLIRLSPSANCNKCIALNTDSIILSTSPLLFLIGGYWHVNIGMGKHFKPLCASLKILNGLECWHEDMIFLSVTNKLFMRKPNCIYHALGSVSKSLPGLKSVGVSWKLECFWILCSTYTTLCFFFLNCYNHSLRLLTIFCM